MMDADTLLVLGAGRLLEHGSPEELMMTPTPIVPPSPVAALRGAALTDEPQSAAEGGHASGERGWSPGSPHKKPPVVVGVFASMVAAARAAHDHSSTYRD